MKVNKFEKINHILEKKIDKYKDYILISTNIRSKKSIEKGEDYIFRENDITLYSIHPRHIDIEKEDEQELQRRILRKKKAQIELKKEEEERSKTDQVGTLVK